MTLPDGVYLGLPMAEYVADPALSGSAFYHLLTEPGAIAWNSPANPLWDGGESSKGQLRGSAAHSAILEGLAAYEAAYCVAPQGALKTGEDMSAWLAKAKAAREDLAGLKISGKVGELRARIEDARRLIAENDELWPVFYDEKIGGRAVLSANDDAFVRILHRFVHSDVDFRRHLTGGLPEVTIVLTREGVRYKCRIDYMTAGGDLDLKTYGRPPNLDSSLKRHLVRQAFYNGAHLQAAHNATMAAHAGALLRSGRLEITNMSQAEPPVFVDAVIRLRDIFALRAARPPVFRWLFLRMDGPPTGMLIPFRQSDGMYQKALADIEHAVTVYQNYVATCGAGELWFTSAGEQEIDDTDWPLGAWEGKS